MKQYLLLEAETGKVYVKPFYDLKGAFDAIRCPNPIIRQCMLLPKPLVIVSDPYGLDGGQHINFMASFFYGYLNHQIIFGDCLILSDRNYDGFPDTRVDGLDDTELRFACLNLSQAFGVNIPGYVAV